MKFVKRLNTRSVKDAPKQLLIDNVMYANPTEEQYLSQGWKKLVESEPETRTGWITVLTYEENDTEVTEVYKYYKDLTPFDISKLKLHVALVKIGLWDAFLAFMKSNTIDIEGVSMPLYDAYQEAQVLSTGDAMFNEYIKLALDQFSDKITEEQVYEILYNCKAD